MKVAGFYNESMANGLGWRAVLFVSGCPHHCPGCHNKVTWDFNYGEEFSQTKRQELLDKIFDSSILKGITLSGGEPMCPENIEEVYNFVLDVKKVRPKFDVWCYSGYTFEELLAREDTITSKMLNEIDVLVDGRFILAKKDPTLLFRGFSNQRIIDVKKSLKEGQVVLLDMEGMYV